MQKVDIRAGMLLPFPFLVMAAIIVFIGLILIDVSLIAAFAVTALGIGMLTAFEGTEIDTGKKVIREYKWFLFMKFGTFQNYERIERVYINESKVSRRYHTAHTSQSSTFTTKEANAYLKLSNGDAIHLFSGTNKETIIARLNTIARSLNLETVDPTPV